MFKHSSYRGERSWAGIVLWMALAGFLSGQVGYCLGTDQFTGLVVGIMGLGLLGLVGLMQLARANQRQRFERMLQRVADKEIAAHHGRLARRESEAPQWEMVEV